MRCVKQHLPQVLDPGYQKWVLPNLPKQSGMMVVRSWGRAWGDAGQRVQTSNYKKSKFGDLGHSLGTTANDIALYH